MFAKIGLFGFGCVGQGLYHVLKETQGIRAQIAKIAVKQRHKARPLPMELFTFDKEDILGDPEIKLVVELIDDADEAYHIVKQALMSGKHVVTANKKMLAHHLDELIELQQQYGVSLLYEASACGSIPIIRNLEEYYDNDLLNGLYGIFNGSTNYILSKMFNEKTDYPEALAQAQALGFAESDPRLDVEAFDPLYKLVILAAHSFGLIVPPDEVFNFGISTMNAQDLQYALEKSRKIKLLATVRKIGPAEVALYVVPHFVAEDDFMYSVEREYNAVNVEAAFSDKQLLIGKGAGGNPTGAAVLADIAALSYGYKYEYKKRQYRNSLRYSTDLKLKVYFRYNQEDDLERLRPIEISERYQSADFKYVVAKVSLQTLFDTRDYILEKGLFLAVWP